MASSYDAFPALPSAPMSRVPPGNLIGTDGYAPEMHHSNEVVQLNVGGTIYSTLYDTLVNSKSKFFEHMLRVDPQSGRVVVFKQNVIEDDEGRLFINRDGHLFGYVLQYMRDGKRTVIPESPDLIRQLAREAEFFTLDRYRALLLERLTEEERSRNVRNETLDSIKSALQQITQQLYTASFKKS
uniref:Potassium channel tetramerisation-type BTB domain-containing protein n=1 Tax=Ascaris lumbricoides TaxID=6252 RepID=A0A9J2PF14_ASCLU